MTEALIHDLMIILAAGLAAGLLCRLLNVSVLVGYLLVGVLLGPGVTGWVVDERAELAHIAEGGVFLLLFTIGLEFSLGDLRRLGRNLLVGGSVQMLLVGGPISAWLIANGQDWRSAVLVASALAFSSTVLVFKALSEWGQAHRPPGRRAIGILLFQDAALVPLLLLVPLLTGDGEAVRFGQYILLATMSVGFLAMVVAMRYVIGQWLIPTLARYRSPELVILFTIVVLGAVTWAAHLVGLPPAVGAFAAGLIFNGNRWSRQIDALVLPFRETFSAVFFIGLGMILDPALLAREPWGMLTAFVALVLVKAVAATIALRLTGLAIRPAIGMGIGLAHVGEFAFVLALLGFESGVVSHAAYEKIVALAVGTLLLTPPLMKLGFRWTRDETEMDSGQVTDVAPRRESHRVAVIGAGPIGRQVASQWEIEGKDVCVVDLSQINLHAFAQEGFRTVCGDATEAQTLQFAEVDRCFAVAVCVPVDAVAIRTVRKIRQLNRQALIVVRCRYQATLPKLKSVGADHVVSEEAEASIALTRFLATAGAKAPNIPSEGPQNV
ncbi:cation:proton antiporter [Crateriforma conspicua]|uniref:Inner membrane protein YbaL n=1 Tax=Crateriforma conspicua TaxID=2527996 RepID=A0A5C5Y3T5_9PLAN|nr:cation:proton antiporter [Crateriforma conspicua]TWT69598.1 Inner membrane protein YbaL [Crateriforma conspicua]